jgi:hypothetical protein
MLPFTFCGASTSEKTIAFCGSLAPKLLAGVRPTVGTGFAELRYEVPVPG